MEKDNIMLEWKRLYRAIRRILQFGVTIFKKLEEGQDI